MKVSATLKGTPDTFGRRTVYIRIVENGKRKFHATSIKIHPKDWNKKVKPSHPAASNINQQIRSKIDFYESGNQVKELLFSEYAKICLNEWDKLKAYETIRHLKYGLLKFSSWKDPLLSQITPELLGKFVSHCYSLGNKGNTVWSSLKFVKTLINKAHREGLIPGNPFRLFTMPKYRDPVKKFLSKDQVRIIESANVGDYTLARDWFVIACYTGLRYSDLRAFDKSKVRDGRLIIYTSKTGQVVSIKLNDKLLGLFTKVGFKGLAYTNEHYNRILKAIGAICEVGPLSSHIARHSFGTMCASAGISQEVTAKLMGHSSIKMTSIYYQLTGTRIDSEMEKLF